MEMLVALAVALMVVLITLGVPVAFSIGIAGLLGLTMVSGVDYASKLVPILTVGIVASYSFVAVPMFLLLGEVADSAGIARGTYDALNKIVGRVRGALMMATILTCGFFSAASGSSTASTALFAKMSVPEMLRLGYDRRFTLGGIASAGVLDALIPPSIPLVLYGMLAEQPIATLFTASIVPGVITMVGFVLLVRFILRRNPHLAPCGEPATWKEKIDSLAGVWPLFLVVSLVIGSIYLGIASVTEASAVGALGTIVVALLQRKLSRGAFRNCLNSTARTSTLVFVILVGGFIFAAFVNQTGLPTAIVVSTQGWQVAPQIVMLAAMGIYLVLGCLMDGASILVLTVPFFVPLAVGLGFDPIWAGVWVTFMIEIGLLTPPVGINCFVVKACVPDSKLEDAFAGAIPYFGLLCGISILLIFVPELTLWLPRIIR